MRIAISVILLSLVFQSHGRTLGDFGFGVEKLFLQDNNEFTTKCVKFSDDDIEIKEHLFDYFQIYLNTVQLDSPIFSRELSKVWKKKDDKHSFYASMEGTDEYILTFNVPFGFNFMHSWSSVDVSQSKSCYEVKTARPLLKIDYHTEKYLSNPNKLTTIPLFTSTQSFPGRENLQFPSESDFNIVLDESIVSIFKNELGFQKLKLLNRKLTFQEYLILFHRYTGVVLEYSAMENVEDPPKSFDPREEFPECFGAETILHQGTCGSCWAMSVTTVATHRTCMKDASNIDTKTGFVRPASPASLTSCSYFQKFMGCDGGGSLRSSEFQLHKSLTTIDAMPFNGRCYKKKANINFSDCSIYIENGFKPWQLPCSCNEVESPSARLSNCPAAFFPKAFESISYEEKIPFYHAQSSYYIPTYIPERHFVKWLKHELSSRGPILLSLDFTSVKTFVADALYGDSFNDLNTNGHAVVIIGYLENDLFLIKNSWGISSHDRGVVKIMQSIVIHSLIEENVPILSYGSMTPLSSPSVSRPILKSKAKAAQESIKPAVKLTLFDNKISIGFSSESVPMNVELNLITPAFTYDASLTLKHDFFLKPGIPQSIDVPLNKYLDEQNLAYNLVITPLVPTAANVNVVDRIVLPHLDRGVTCSRNGELLKEFRLKKSTWKPELYLKNLEDLLQSYGFAPKGKSCFLLTGLMSTHSSGSEFNIAHFSSSMSFSAAVALELPNEVQIQQLKTLLMKYDEKLNRDRSFLTAYFVKTYRQNLAENKYLGYNHFFNTLENLDPKKEYQVQLSHMLSLVDAFRFLPTADFRKVIVSTAMNRLVNPSKSPSGSFIDMNKFFDIETIAKYGVSELLLNPYVNKIRSSTAASYMALLNKDACQFIYGEKPDVVSNEKMFYAIIEHVGWESSSTCLKHLLRTAGNQHTLDAVLNDGYYRKLLWSRFNTNIFSNKRQPSISSYFRQESDSIIGWAIQNSDILDKTTFSGKYDILNYPYGYTSILESQLGIGHITNSLNLYTPNGFKSVDSMIGSDYASEKIRSRANTELKKWSLKYFRNFDSNGFTNIVDPYEIRSYPQSVAALSLPGVDLFTSPGVLYMASEGTYIEFYCMNPDFNYAYLLSNINKMASNKRDSLKASSVELCLDFAARVDASGKQFLKVLGAYVSNHGRITTSANGGNKFTFLSYLHGAIDPSFVVALKTNMFYPGGFTWNLLGLIKDASRGTLIEILNLLKTILTSSTNLNKNVQTFEGLNIVFKPGISGAFIYQQYALFVSAFFPHMPPVLDAIVPADVRFSVFDDPIMSFNSLSAALVSISLHGSNSGYSAEHLKLLMKDETQLNAMITHALLHPWVISRIKPTYINNILSSSPELDFFTQWIYSNKLKSEERISLLISHAFLPALMVGNLDLVSEISKVAFHDDFEKMIKTMENALNSNLFINSIMNLMSNHNLGVLLSPADASFNNKILHNMYETVNYLKSIHSTDSWAPVNLYSDDFTSTYVGEMRTFIDSKWLTDGVNAFKKALSSSASYTKINIFSIKELFCSLYSPKTILLTPEEQLPLVILSMIFHSTQKFSDPICADGMYLTEKLLKLKDWENKLVIPQSIHPFIRRSAVFLTKPNNIISSVISIQESSPRASPEKEFVISGTLHSVLLTDQEIVLRAMIIDVLDADEKTFVDSLNYLTEGLMSVIEGAPLLDYLKAYRSQVYNDFFSGNEDFIKNQGLRCHRILKMYYAINQKFISRKIKWSNFETLNALVLKYVSHFPVDVI